MCEPLSLWESCIPRNRWLLTYIYIYIVLFKIFILNIQNLNEYINMIISNKNTDII